jgi:RNA polymerase sigma factor (sigma-70 family)
VSFIPARGRDTLFFYQEAGRMCFEELANKLSPTVKRIAYKLNGHYRSFSHDDLYQEAMLHLWNNFRLGRISDKTDSYILQGCYFHLKNYIRKVNEKSNMVSLDMAVGDEGKDLEDILAPKYLSVEDSREYLHNKLLAESINNNGFDLREKKILSFLAEGLTTRDIGKRLGFSHVSIVKVIGKIKQKAARHID